MTSEGDGIQIVEPIGENTVFVTSQSPYHIVDVFDPKIDSQSHYGLDLVLGPPTPRSSSADPASCASAPQLFHLGRHFQIENGGSLGDFGEFVSDSPIGGG